MIEDYVKEINPNFEKWDELYAILDSFKNWEEDVAEPPSSGAFSCASQSADLAAGATAYFACAGEKHLPFEKCILKFRTSPICFGNGYGFGHPIYKDNDPRVIDFLNRFPQTDWRMDTVLSYVKNKQNYGSDKPINFAGLFGVWCLVNDLDERAAILPLMSRLLGLCITYEIINHSQVQMSVSAIPVFLQGQRVKAFVHRIKPHHVFGLGVSWNKKTQKIDGVRLILRDSYDASSLKGFAKTPEEKSVVEFFSSLPHGHEDPNHGLHGSLYSLKISAKGDFKQAFYRRLGRTPVSFEEGDWAKYLYEDLHEYAFRDVKPPDDASKLFCLETKCDFEGVPKAFMLYPKYDLIRESGDGVLRNGFAEFFGAYINTMLNGFQSVIDDFDSIVEDADMTPVSIGETEASIKAYFVDFGKSV